jgi:hypothetical protein
MAPRKGWRPNYRDEVPTLGWEVIAWMEWALAAPDRADYEPFRLTQEQAQFVLNFYALEARSGQRRYRRGMLSRPKGWGKSPLLSGIAAAEALGPVVPAGWDAKGQPVGKPWVEVRTPLVQVCAVSEDQTANCWSPLLEMLRDGPATDLFVGLDPMETFINLPRGRVEYVTSSPTSREGNRPVFAVLDQTESWVVSNGGTKMAATVRRNLGKTGGHSIEAPNAFVPGEGSVAESSMEYARRIAEGHARDDGLLVDHREAPPATDFSDPDSLRAGLVHAYGDSAMEAGGWVDLDRIMAEVWDPDTDPQDARRYYGNQVTHATDSWLSEPELLAVARTDVGVRLQDQVVLGFDGSRQRSDAVTDATALIGCRVSDGHLFTVQVWEPPPGAAGKGWRVPTGEVDLMVHEAFRKWRVVGMFCDPAKWDTWVASWEARYSTRLRVKASQSHPMEWWMTGGRTGLIVRALDEFHSAVVDGELTYDGSGALTRHLLNARRRVTRSGITIAKPHPESPLKIDAAVAAVLAWQARTAAVAAGIGRELEAPIRVR